MCIVSSFPERPKLKLQTAALDSGAAASFLPAESKKLDNLPFGRYNVKEIRNAVQSKNGKNERTK